MPSPLAAKRQGEQAELAFLYRTSTLGVVVSKPYGDSAAYDFIVDAGAGVLLRVQVKSVAAFNGKDYHLNTGQGGRHKRGYTAGDIDLLAAYVVPCDAWYIIPVSALAGLKTIHLCPHRPSNYKFEPFRDAWHLLFHDGPAQQVPRKI